MRIAESRSRRRRWTWRFAVERSLLDPTTAHGHRLQHQRVTRNGMIRAACIAPSRRQRSANSSIRGPRVGSQLHGGKPRLLRAQNFDGLSL